MAQAVTTNFYIQQYTNLSADVRYYNYYRFPQSRELIMSSRQATFAFIVTVLPIFLQVKYQGQNQSPFETNPKTTFLAIACLLLYCLSYDANLRISQHRHRPSSFYRYRSRSNYYTYYCYLVRSSMPFFGLLSLASILSILVPEPKSFSLVLYFLAIFFTLFQLPGVRMMKIWNWLQAVIVRKFRRFPHQSSAAFGDERLLVSVQLPSIPEDDIIDQIHPLPE